MISSVSLILDVVLVTHHMFRTDLESDCIIFHVQRYCCNVMCDRFSNDRNAEIRLRGIVYLMFLTSVILFMLSNEVWWTLILPLNKANVNCESAVICQIICIQKVWWLILYLMKVDKRKGCQHYLLYDPPANQNLKRITQKWSFWHHLLSFQNCILFCFLYDTKEGILINA